MRFIERKLIVVAKKVKADKTHRLDYMQPVIYRSHDNDIIIAFPHKYEFRQMCRYECSFDKKPPNPLGDWKRKPGGQ